MRTSLDTTKSKAKFILATDWQTLEAEELGGSETIVCDYPNFPNHCGFFCRWRHRIFAEMEALNLENQELTCIL